MAQPSNVPAGVTTSSIATTSALVVLDVAPTSRSSVSPTICHCCPSVGIDGKKRDRWFIDNYSNPERPFICDRLMQRKPSIVNSNKIVVLNNYTGAECFSFNCEAADLQTIVIFRTPDRVASLFRSICVCLKPMYCQPQQDNDFVL